MPPVCERANESLANALHAASSGQSIRCRKHTNTGSTSACAVQAGEPHTHTHTDPRMCFFSRGRLKEGCEPERKKMGESVKGMRFAFRGRQEVECALWLIRVRRRALGLVAWAPRVDFALTSFINQSTLASWRSPCSVRARMCVRARRKKENERKMRRKSRPKKKNKL